MPMLPDPAHMDIIDKACISAFEAEEPVSVFCFAKILWTIRSSPCIARITTI